MKIVKPDVRGRSVLLKPNLVEYAAGSSINTDPRLVVAAANTLRRLGASSVVVAEGPGHRRDTEAVLLASGMHEALADARIPFVDLNDAPLVRTPLRTSYTGLRELWVPRVLRETEVVVSMPKLKTHHWVGVTMSLKNCFGCMPGRVYGWPKDVFHVRGIPESILDIVAAVRPSLTIVDGIVGMEGDGPIMGDPVASGVVVVSEDLVAADVTGVRLMGMEPEKVPYLMEAGRFLGQARSELITQRGEDPGASREAVPARAELRVAGRVARPFGSQSAAAASTTANAASTRTAPATVSASLVSPQVTSGTSQMGESLGRTTASGTAASAK